MMNQYIAKLVNLPTIASGLNGDFEFVLLPDGHWNVALLSPQRIDVKTSRRCQARMAL